jgi:hypothetical protein
MRCRFANAGLDNGDGRKHTWLWLPHFCPHLDSHSSLPQWPRFPLPLGGNSFQLGSNPKEARKYISAMAPNPCMMMTRTLLHDTPSHASPRVARLSTVRTSPCAPSWTVRQKIEALPTHDISRCTSDSKANFKSSFSRPY